LSSWKRWVAATAAAIAVALVILSCGSRGPIEPPPPPPGPVEPVEPVEPVKPIVDLFVVVLDSRPDPQPIVGAGVTVTNEDGTAGLRLTDGAGFVHFPVTGSVQVEVTKSGFVTKLTNLPPGAHRVHLDRAPIAGVGEPPWKGRLQVSQNQRGFVDEDHRWQLPLLAHFGEAFSAYIRRPADVEDQLIAIKQAGYDGIRFWDTLGYWDGAWRNKEVMPWGFVNHSGQSIPATANYYDHLRGFLLLLKQVGLAAHHSRGDLNHQPLSRVVEHAERVAQVYDQVGWDILAVFEGNNEDFQNGSFGAAGLRAITEPARRRGAITASSCPGLCTEELADFVEYTRGFPIFYVHGFRNGQATDRLRHIFSLGYELHAHLGGVRLGWQGEPPGPNDFPGIGVTVGHTEDIEELGLLAVQSLIFRQGWVYMSQYGVFWNGRIDTHSGFRVVPQMRVQLLAFAPDVMGWSVYHGSRPEAVLRSPTGYYGDPGVNEGPARIDQAISSDRRRVVATVHGGRGTKGVRNDLGCVLDVKVVQPRDDETVDVHNVTLSPGQVLPLNYRVGRMLLGSCQ